MEKKGHAFSVSVLKWAAFICLGLLVCIGSSLYSSYKEQMNQTAYAEQMGKAYEKMSKNIQEAEQLVSDYIEGKDSSVSSRHLHAVKELEKEAEECLLMMDQLSDPPSGMKEAYALLLDAHIAYKQYVQLALHPQELSNDWMDKERRLKAELNSHLKLVKQRVAQR
ncbi:hypothetical protein [Bacillus thermotolerans]|uniref:Uncharacterized protein n=1 Tax=Bacillus thermotolerans TaxID=1221996 RepID=A0A0F5IBC3_BACTR|nr:hypothetical protein [Bacillus thermotolerans]KKB38855.1 hypothetical protein QY97_01098 [Bacillus thermotolerans]KKB42477.1 hypothetical protein QY95_00326 [Bacillus thermotolerans]KKB44575.1 hypothetical protein QY96_02195 [Bacillus thermotolerans]